MSEINWQDFKCRCSAITQMLSNSVSNAPLTELQVKELSDLDAKENKTEKQKERLTELFLKKENSKKIVLSDTCIGYLMEHYAWITEQAVCVTKEMDIDYFHKGRLMEEDGIALLSIVDVVEYKKNDIRIYNDYLSGEPDVFKGEEIYKATKIIDTKLSWDYPGFLKKINTPVSNDNKQQVQGYCDITGATDGEIADVLVNMPETIINDYRWKLAKKMDAVTLESPDFKKAEESLLKSMIFDRIPRHLRVFKKKVVPFTEFERQKVYDKVKICRDWLFKFDETYKKNNN